MFFKILLHVQYNILILSKFTASVTWVKRKKRKAKANFFIQVFRIFQLDEFLIYKVLKIKLLWKIETKTNSLLVKIKR